MDDFRYLEEHDRRILESNSQDALAEQAWHDADDVRYRVIDAYEKSFDEQTRLEMQSDAVRRDVESVRDYGVGDVQILQNFMNQYPHLFLGRTIEEQEELVRRLNLDPAALFGTDGLMVPHLEGPEPWAEYGYWLQEPTAQQGYYGPVQNCMHDQYDTTYGFPGHGVIHADPWAVGTHESYILTGSSPYGPPEVNPSLLVPPAYVAAHYHFSSPQPVGPVMVAGA